MSDFAMCSVHILCTRLFTFYRVRPPIALLQNEIFFFWFFHLSISNAPEKAHIHTWHSNEFMRLFLTIIIRTFIPLYYSCVKKNDFIISLYTILYSKFQILTLPYALNPPMRHKDFVYLSNDHKINYYFWMVFSIVYIIIIFTSFLFLVLLSLTQMA